MDVNIKITEKIAKKVIDTVDAGLCSGIGQPVPGEMCVEAAVCYAMGMPHDDKPSCVSSSLRSLKIRLNDSVWSSKKARAEGLKELALLQLGSKGVLNEEDFITQVAIMTTRVIVPIALRHAAQLQTDELLKVNLLKSALACELIEGTLDAAYHAASAANHAASAAYHAASAASAANHAASAAYHAASAVSAANHAASAANHAASAVSAANHAASDSVLKIFAVEVGKILIKMAVPGVQWLYLLNKPSV